MKKELKIGSLQDYLDNIPESDEGYISKHQEFINSLIVKGNPCPWELLPFIVNE